MFFIVCFDQDMSFLSRKMKRKKKSRKMYMSHFFLSFSGFYHERRKSQKVCVAQNIFRQEQCKWIKKGTKHVWNKICWSASMYFGCTGPTNDEKRPFLVAIDVVTCIKSAVKHSEYTKQGKIMIKHKYRM